MNKKQWRWVGGVFIAFFLLTGCAGVQMKTSNLIFQAKDKVSNGDLVGSLPFLKKALALEPDDVEANATMARVQYCLGHFQAARRYAEKTLRLNPRDFRAMGIVGLVNLRSKKYSEGIDLMTKAMKIYNELEPIGGNFSVEPKTILKQMRYKLKHGQTITQEDIDQLASAFWGKVNWYEFDQEYRKWHFYSFYEDLLRPDGGNTYP
jgi:tetratricopeptide (TPR) repeat protein